MNCKKYSKVVTEFAPGTEYLEKAFDAIHPLVSNVVKAEYYDEYSSSNGLVSKLSIVSRNIKLIADGDYTSNMNIVILYHTDLDGNMSAFTTLMYLEALKGYYGVSSTANNIHIKALPINYPYSLDKYEDDISDANIIFLVDYSVVSNFAHIDRMIEAAKSGTYVFWIDHHESSIIGSTNPVSKYYDKCQEFVKTDRVYHSLHTGVGLSAAMLCYTLYSLHVYSLSKRDDIFKPAISTIVLNLMAYRNKEGDVTVDVLASAIVLSCPEVIIRTSLYDTFHPLSEREFMLGISSMETSPYSLYNTAYNTTEDEHVSYRTMLDNLYCLLDNMDGNGIEVPFMNIDANKIYHLSILQRLINDVGKTLMDYDIMMHNRVRGCSEFDIKLSIGNKNGRESYSVAVLNTNGNSFAFEESFHNHDAVILWYQNKNMDYVYSIFADLSNPHHVHCRTVAEYFNGGGHAGAAGWQSRFNLFDVSSKYFWGYGIEFVPKDPDGSTPVLFIFTDEQVNLINISPRVSDGIISMDNK